MFLRPMTGGVLGCNEVSHHYRTRADRQDICVVFYHLFSFARYPVAMASLLLISTSDVISSFTVEPIILKVVHLGHVGFPFSLISGAVCLPFVLVTASLLVVSQPARNICKFFFGSCNEVDIIRES